MKKILLLATLYITFATQLMAANILVIGLGQPGEDPSLDGLRSILQSDGHTVGFLSYAGPTGGAIATHLSTNTYDQIFLYDVTSSLIIDPADAAAVAGFWTNQKGLVVDGRSYGYLFQATEPSEQALLRNVANTFTLTNGGLWIGTDDDQWAYNGSAVLNALGANSVTGNYSLPVNLADPSSVLLQNVIPANLWAAAGTVGAVPLGIQPNGIEMFIHFGNDTNGVITPYISASFPLRGPPVNPPVIVPVPVNQPWALSLIALALLSLVSLQRKQHS